MDSNKLILSNQKLEKILEKELPLKSYPKDEELNKEILLALMPFISGLLSLTDEVSANRLKIALPAVKEHCWSMGFAEIVKMFTMYADNKLSIKPIPNYFDRILFGKIVEAYKQQKPTKKKEIKMPEISQEEKDLKIKQGVISCFDEFIRDNEIPPGYVWVYDHLDEFQIISYSDEEKIRMMPIAKEKLIIDKKNDLNRSDYKVFITSLENNREKQAVVNKAKRMLLERFFRVLDAKDKHIKDII
jgi:hypothetical protein